MANLNKLVQGKVRVRYHQAEDKLFPMRFYAPDLLEAHKVALRQAVADLIVNDADALDDAASVLIDSMSIEE